MMPKHVLVTGGTGFIGAALVRRLVGDGHRVRVLDNDSRGSAGRLDDIADDFERISGDVRDATAVEKAARGVDAVHHLAEHVAHRARGGHVEGNALQGGGVHGAETSGIS